MKKSIKRIIALAITIVAIFASNIFAENLSESKGGDRENLSTIVNRVADYNEDGTKTYNYTMYVLVPSKKEKGNNILTREKVIKLLEAKYREGVVSKIYKQDEKTEISENDAKVGTGSIVELTTGKRLTVVLYGDVTGDGEINLYDTIAVAEHNVRRKSITDKYKFKAAELTGDKVDGIVTLNDTTRLACYNVALLGVDEKYGMSIVDSGLCQEDYVEKVDLDEIISTNVNAQSQDTHFAFTFDNQATISMKVQKRDEKLVDLLNKETAPKYIEKLLENDKIKSVTLNAGIEGVPAQTFNKEDKENIVDIIKKYFEENVDKIFGRESLADVIMGDFDEKNFALTVELVDDVELKDEKLEERQFSKTYTISFTAVPIKITYDYNHDKTKQDIVEQEHAGLVTKPTDPTRQEEREGRTINFEFKTWHRKNGEEIEKEAFDFENTKIEKDITLVASWIEIVDEDYDVNDVLEVVNQNEEQNAGEKRYNIAFVKSEGKANSHINIGILKGETKIPELFESDSNIIELLKTSLQDKKIKEIDIKYGEEKVIFDKEEEVTIKLIELLKKVLNVENALDGEPILISEYEREVALDDSEELTAFLEQIQDKKLSDLLQVKLEVQVILNEGYKLKEDETAIYSVEFNGTFNPDEWFKQLVESQKVGTEYLDLTYDAQVDNAKITAKIKTEKEAESMPNVNNTNILKALQDIVKSGEIKSVNISLRDDTDKLQLDNPGNDEDTTISTAEKWIKEKLATKLGKDSYSNTTLKDLEGHIFLVELNLHDNIQLNDGYNNGKKSKTYKLCFEEVIKKGDIIGKALGENTSDDKYTATYADGTITVTPKLSNANISSMSNEDESKVLEEVLGNPKIEKIELKYGANKDKTIDLKTLLKDVEANQAEAKVIEWLKANWKDFCSCTKDCCSEEDCSFEKATNNCLIESSEFDITVTLDEAVKFEGNGTGTETYKLKFKRNDVKIELNFKENGATQNTTKNITIKEGEGLPITEQSLKEQAESQGANYPTWEEHEFNYWASDENRTRYDFNNKIIAKDGDEAELKLYGVWWLVLDFDSDISKGIAASQLTASFGEELKPTEGHETPNEVKIDIIDTKKNITDVLKTGVGTALKDELNREEVQSIEVSYVYETGEYGKTQQQTKTVTFSGETESDKAQYEDLFNTMIANPQRVPKPVVGAAESAISTVDLTQNTEVLIGKDLDVKINYDNTKAKLSDSENSVNEYKVKFIKYVTYEEIHAIGDKELETHINVNKTKVIVTRKKDEGEGTTLIGDCKNVKDDTILGAATGCGAATALPAFLQTGPINSVTVGEHETGTKGTIYGGTDTLFLAIELAVIFTGGDLSVLESGNQDAISAVLSAALENALAMTVQDWIGRNIDIEIGLKEGYEFKEGKPLVYLLEVIDSTAVTP